jgi:hypothetical protein
MRTTIVWILVAAAALAYGKLPPQSDAAKAQAAQSAAKAAWDDKVSAYKTCRAQDRAADMYRSNLEAAAKDIPTPTATASCADSGPYVAPVTPVESNSKLSRRIHLPERPLYRRVRTCRRPKCPRHEIARLAKSLAAGYARQGWWVSNRAAGTVDQLGCRSRICCQASIGTRIGSRP